MVTQEEFIDLSEFGMNYEQETAELRSVTKSGKCIIKKG